MFFVATREVVLVVHTTHYTAYTQTQSRTDTPHGLLSGVMDNHGVKTYIDKFNHCAPPKQHYIIRSFKQYVKLINRIMDIPGNPGKSRD